jgi:hypothetical protein
VAGIVIDSHLHGESAAGLDPGPMKVGYVRNRHLLPREATFLSKEELDLVMGGTAERLWFG